MYSSRSLLSSAIRFSEYSTVSKSFSAPPNLRNSRKERGKTRISSALPLNSVGISRLETFELEPVMNILMFSVSYILLSHLLHCGMSCISSRKKYSISPETLLFTAGRRAVRNSVFSGILSSSKFMYITCSRSRFSNSFSMR